MRMDLFMAHHPNLKRPKRNGMEGDSLAHASPDHEIDKPQFLDRSFADRGNGDRAPQRRGKDRPK